MTPYIKITRYPYEEPFHLNLVVDASNDKFSCKQEIYTSTKQLVELADNLEQFPGKVPSEYLWELGSEKTEERLAFYLLIKVFTFDSIGHCAIQIRVNNNKDLPDREVSEFCIFADPASINRLGKIMREYSKLEHSVLYWDSDTENLDT